MSELMTPMSFEHLLNWILIKWRMESELVVDVYSIRSQQRFF